MLQNISNTAILLLVIWLSYVTTQNSVQLSQLQARLAMPATMLSEQLNFQQATTQKLTIMTGFINQQQQASQQLQSAQATLVHHQQITALTRVYGDLLSTELLLKSGDLAAAINLLKASKEGIWEAGDIFSAHKAALQGLMQPIDENLHRWQAGNPSSILVVYQTVHTVLQAINEGK